MRVQKENGKKQQTMAERKLVIQEQHGWREDGNRFEAIREFQIWPLSVKLKTRQAQKNKVFQPLYGIVSFFLQTKDANATYQVEVPCLCHWTKYENPTLRICEWLPVEQGQVCRLTGQFRCGCYVSPV